MLISVGISVLTLLVAGIIVWFLFLTPAPDNPSGRKAPSPGVLAATIAFVLIDELFLAYAGVLGDWTVPPPLMLMMAVVIGATVLMAFTGPGTRIARDLPYAALIGYQAFRLPLEVVMHQAAETGLMPVQMSYSGYNFDILTGILAIPVALAAWQGKAPPALLIAWNAMGSLLLLIIVGIAVASTPLFAAFGPESLNTWIADVPYIWLPGGLVPAALFGHLVVWRKLAGVAPIQAAAPPKKVGRRSKR